MREELIDTMRQDRQSSQRELMRLIAELEHKLNLTAHSLETNIFEVSQNSNGATDAKVNNISSEVALLRVRLQEMSH
jgi:hypothetical protein